MLRKIKPSLPRKSQMTTTLKYPRAFFSLLLFLLTLAVFWLGLSGGFILDDNHAIAQNTALHITQFNWDSLRLAANSFGGGARPLPMLSFAFNHMADGLNPWGYKLTGLVIHALNAILIYCVLLCVLRDSGIGEKQRVSGAFLLALVWAAHPLQVSTALYVVQRMETLSLFFVLLGLLAYIKGRERQISGKSAWLWLLMAPLAAAPGLLCKESALLFPVYCLALELTLLRFRAHSKATARGLRYFYALATILAFALFIVFALKHYSAATIFARNFNTPERLMTQLRVLVMYLQQIMMPLPGSMTFHYDQIAVSRGLLSPWTTAASGLFLLALLLSAWRVRMRYPLFALGAFLFFSGHLLTSNLVNLELAFEHRNYFALVGVLLAITEGVIRIPIRTSIKYAGLATLVIGVLSLGAIRANLWGNPLMLAMDMVARNPDSSRATIDLGIAYYRAAQGNPKSPYFQAAEQTFVRGAAMPNVSIVSITNLLMMNSFKEEKSASREYWDKLDHYFRNKGPLTSEIRSSVYNLLNRRVTGEIMIDEARLLQTLEIMDDDYSLPATIHFGMGICALKFLHDPETARKHLLLAIEKGHDDPALLSAVILNALRFGLIDVVGKATSQQRAHAK
jgi:hypothetical protein